MPGRPLRLPPGLDPARASASQITRDTFVRDALLALASGDARALWETVTTTAIAKGIGDIYYDATTPAAKALENFNGTERPEPGCHRAAENVEIVAEDQTRPCETTCPLEDRLTYKSRDN
ncbi:MAG: carboxylesterase [Glaciihabitans sp.]|nr:carboxylesterase [Glaciihabitans sp.]